MAEKPLIVARAFTLALSLATEEGLDLHSRPKMTKKGSWDECVRVLIDYGAEPARVRRWATTSIARVCVPVRKRHDPATTRPPRRVAAVRY